MSKRTTISMVATLVAGLLGLFIASCGGDDASGSGDPLTKADFVKQANAICDEANEKIRKQIQNVSILIATVNALETEIDEIGALTPPPGDEPRIEAMLGALQKSIDAIESKSQDIITANAELAKAEKIAKEYGLGRTCLIARSA